MSRENAVNSDALRVAYAVRRIKDGSDSIDNEHKGALIAYLRAGGAPFTCYSAAELFGIHRSVLARLLTELVAEGRLRRVLADRDRRNRGGTRRPYLYQLDDTHPDYSGESR